MFGGITKNSIFEFLAAPEISELIQHFNPFQRLVISTAINLGEPRNFSLGRGGCNIDHIVGIDGFWRNQLKIRYIGIKCFYQASLVHDFQSKRRLCAF